MITSLIRLYFIHISAFFAGAFSLYYPGLDIIVSVMYLIVIAVEARRTYEMQLLGKIFIALLWQVPAIFFSIMIIGGFDILGLHEYAIFILQFWYTPLVGLISLAGFTLNLDKPLYYYVLLYLPFFIALYYTVMASLNIAIKKEVSYIKK